MLLAERYQEKISGILSAVDQALLPIKFTTSKLACVHI